ncbi:hypothetical protein [Paenibacillus alba]|uniref:DUF4309 domain-containing protein n=1 Tax=Paenibacillus alba TaxID=1197127 RepID=A0ABU6G561_9BACL|nr:hypothetical protein [Paenibacillus alba]MEC0229310.1 hypothetical protein [Paenibacillus alba]
MKKVLIMMFSLCLLMTGCAQNSNSDQVGGISPKDTIFDVKKFSQISPDELVQIMGDPESKENWNFKGSKNQFPVLTYAYKGGEIEFQFVENKLKRINYHLPEDASNIGKLVERFGLSENQLKKYKDTNTVVRYYTTIETIYEVYIMVEDKKTSLFRVDYDKGVFE